MRITTLKPNAFNDVLELFYKSFNNDTYYRDLIESNKVSSIYEIRDVFSQAINYCLQEEGFSYGIYNDSELIAFILTTDFKKLCRDKEMYNFIFGTDTLDKNSLRKEKLQKKLSNIKNGKYDTIYCLSIAVAESYRNKGIASLLIDKIITLFAEYHIITDVSNKDSLGIYKTRNFKQEDIDDHYFFLHRRPTQKKFAINFQQTVNIALHSSNILDALNIKYTKERCVYIEDIVKKDDFFINKKNNIEIATIYKLDYDDLLKYQRYVGISDFEEYLSYFFIYYVRFRETKYSGQYNKDVFDALIEERKREWDVIPDVYVSIPCTYSDISRIQKFEGNTYSDLVLANLDFRTKYESGIISRENVNYDETSIFKNRIKRIYLGTVSVCLCDENNIGHVEDYSLIGSPNHVDLYLSYDIKSECAVIGLYSISCPFIISIFFDNIIRNQIIVINNEKEENLYDYLYRTFKISKSGSPKIYSVIPKSRQCLSDEQIGSLLSGETIYSDGDNFGKIIDKDIMDAVNSEYGMGQYNRGFVLAYLNVVLQFSDNQRSSIEDRIYEAMITQFYIELIMFEEAAINLTDIAITKLLANSEIENTISYLEKAEKINENYAKTICFWDINVNYPTSQKSIDMLRNSFALKRHLKKMERNKAQLQAVYDAKCEIIDRKDSKRIDSSLAVLAVLAIFSALIDSFDYIGVWASYFPAKFIKTLQILNSSVIVLIGLYVIIRLYGSNMLKRLKSLMHKSN